MPGLLLLTVTVLMVGVAGAMWWLARADRARIAATQKGGDDRPGSSEVASERMPGHASRTTAARAALTLILLASTAFLIYAWRVQRPSGLMNVDDSDYSTLALRYWRHLGRCTMSQPARRSPMVVAFVLLPYDPCPSWSS
jgi:hypothetical protein